MSEPVLRHFATIVEQAVGHERVERNGRQDGIATNLSISIEQVEPLALMRKVRDIVSLSASSACPRARSRRAMFYWRCLETARAPAGHFASLRGVFTTVAEIDCAADAIVAAVATLRRLAA